MMKRGGQAAKGGRRLIDADGAGRRHRTSSTGASQIRPSSSEFDPCGVARLVPGARASRTDGPEYANAGRRADPRCLLRPRTRHPSRRPSSRPATPADNYTPSQFKGEFLMGHDVLLTAPEFGHEHGG